MKIEVRWREYTDERRYRGVGVGMCLLSLVIVHFFAYCPLEAAKHHNFGIGSELHWQLYLGSFALPIFMLGAFRSVFGLKGLILFRGKGERERITLLGWIFTGIVVGAGVMSYVWLQGTAAGYGYEF